ncbi:MAG: AAA family ATPase [Spirochaetaceae bacterium]|nr:AAA family ATPase [Myxococcales bacterium]MCB9724951.1 AAA family ATPase [Spirochaetaceae bacterium]
MYLNHFGLSGMPFEATSNGRIYVELPDHREAFNTILFALRSGEGFVKVVGEVGTGKTALCRNLLTALDGEFVTAYLPNPAMRATDLLLSLADELGAALPARTSAHVLKQQTRDLLLAIAREGGRVVILVDEAQTMPAATLEELRLLSNLETSDGKLVQVVLFGQPELDEKLEHYSLRQLQQRISFSARLEPLGREECRYYVSERLAQCGAGPQPIFTPAAIDRIHRASGGIPRLVNVLCHKSLIAAFSDGEYQVSRRHVSRAKSDTEGIQRWQTRPLWGNRTTPARRRGQTGSIQGWRSFPG